MDKRQTASIDIIALSRIDGEFIGEVLRENIKEPLDIRCYSVEDGLNIPQRSPVALLSGPFLKEEIGCLYQDSRIIVAKRTIVGENLAKLMILPRGKAVLVVNYPREVTEETIESLKKMGLNHLTYIPYYGDAVDLKGIDTAVSPGHIYLCPEGIKEKIDLKRRTLAFSTFMEVLQALHLSMDDIDIFAGQHTRQMVQAGREVAELLMDTEKLRMNLKGVVDKIVEGLVTVDGRGEISVFNPVAEEIFGVDSTDWQHKNYQEVFAGYPDITGFIAAGETVSEIFLSVKGRRLLASFTCLESFGEKTMICNFAQVANIQRLEESVRRQINKKGYYAKYSFPDIAGTCPLIRSVIQRAKKFAATELTILLTGESGTGKELFAHSIHNASLRAAGPFIAVNFAALPETLVESELFGYEEGSFTGALKGGKAGLFEQAHKGTIFLDEIGDAPFAVQTRLLRVLQEKEVMRIGASKVIPVDVRVVAATNKRLTELVAAGKFREDLYYRLKVLMLEIPPLRMRKDDIPLLIQKIHPENLAKKISPEAMEQLRHYHWPGNVRELSNVIQYVLSVADGNIITPADLPPDMMEDRKEESREIQKIKEILLGTGHEADYLFILAALKEAKAKGATIGRKKLADSAFNAGLALTEEKIRSRLTKMIQLDLVSSGTTRQGCCISVKGILLLDRWNLVSC